MIVVPESFVPKFIKNNVKKILFSLAVIMVLYVIAHNLLRNFLLQGERHEGLREKITFDLMDSVVVGLDGFYKRNGHYPHSNGKYFYDSIKSYVNIPDAYIYADVKDSNGVFVPLKKPVGKKFDYLQMSNTYLGIGSPQQYIVYVLYSDGYTLYSIGENLIDENGEGDDVMF